MNFQNSMMKVFKTLILLLIVNTAISQSVSDSSVVAKDSSSKVPARSETSEDTFDLEPEKSGITAIGNNSFTKKAKSTKTTDKATKIDWLGHIITGFLSFALSLLLYFFLNSQKTKMIDKFENFKKSVRDQIDELKKNNEKEISDLKTELHELKTSIRKLQDGKQVSPHNQGNSIERKGYLSHTSGLLKREIDTQTFKTLYAKSETNGVFKNVSPKYSSHTLYFHLEVNENEKVGIFQITDDVETFKLIISLGHSYLSSAVQELNDKSKFTSKIETTKNGTLKLNEKGDWEIVDKAQITYR